MTVNNKQRTAYVNKLNEIAGRIDRLDRQTVIKMRDLLLEARSLIAGQVTAVNLTAPAEVEALIERIGDIVAGLDQRLATMTNGQILTAAELGSAFTLEPLTAAGIAVPNIGPSLSQANTLAGFTADLISSITEDMRQQINRQIRIAALSGQTPYKTMQMITKIIGIDPRTKHITKGVSYRAERIYRTEINRAFSVANDSTQKAAAAADPQLQKMWIATGDGRTRADHLAAHGQTQPIKRPFKVGGEKLQYPLDPAGSGKQTINCRCRSVTIHPDIGYISGSNDKLVKLERQKRGNDE